MNGKHFLWAASAALVAVGAAYLSSGPADAAGGRSRFDLAPGELSVALAGSGRNAASYYLTYTLTNPMDEARTPRLYIEARTETGKTYGDRADARVLSMAAAATKIPELKSTAELRGKEVASGASVRGVASFGNIDPSADDITVRVYGLWDPIVRTRQGRVFSEKRVLVLQFARKGDEYDRTMDPISLTSKKEEVEGEPVELYTTSSAAKKK